CSTPSTGTTPAGTQPLSPRRSRLALAAGAGAALIALIALALLSVRRDPSYSLGRQQAITAEAGVEFDPALSPDGRTVAYAAGPSGKLRIFVRQADGRAVAVTPDTGPSQVRPIWSADGTRLFYKQGENLVLVPALGGSPRVMLHQPG